MPGPAQEEEQAAGIPEWVVTFGDMMSLLLTFFIMLVSMSEIKQEQRYQAMAEALRRRFGPESSVTSVMSGRSKPRNSALDKMVSLGRARRMNTMNGGDKVRAPVGDHPRVTTLRSSPYATNGGVVFFSEGSAELTAEDREVLDTIADELGGKPQRIEIRGHTSAKPLPKDSPFRNHWDLAYARCTATMDYLVEKGIDAKRLRLSVAADNEPRHHGYDPLLRKQNPRVEVFMLDELADDPRPESEGPLPDK